MTPGKRKPESLYATTERSRFIAWWSVQSLQMPERDRQTDRRTDGRTELLHTKSTELRAVVLSCLISDVGFWKPYKNGLDASSPVYTIQPVVKPVVKSVWQPVVSCIQPVVKPVVQHGLRTGWMNSGCSFNTVVIPVVQTGLTTGCIV